MPDTPQIIRLVTLPSIIDFGATFLFSITGAMVAIRRHYDLIGVFVLALACGLCGFLGGAFGLLTYATYDLTNAATLKVWSWKVTAADMGWGLLATAVAAGVGCLVLQRMTR